MLMSSRAFKIILFGMDGHTFDITMRLAGLINLRIWMTFPPIEISLVFSTRESTKSLLDRNRQNLLFDILDTKSILLGDIISPTAMTYSFWVIPSMELNTIAWSLRGVFSCVTIDAKFNFGFSVELFV